MIRTQLYRTAALLAVVVAVAAPVWADDVTELGRRLVQLRGEVESLSASLSREDSDLRDQLHSLARQKADLEAELKREQLRVQKIRHDIDQKKSAAEAQKEQSEKLDPVFDATVEALRQYVRRALPFRTPERLAEIDRIVQQRKAGLLTSERGLARLWSFVEDEIRLTRENAMHRQTLSINGTEQLVDVIRLGMVMLFFRTSDDVVGYAVQHQGRWATRALNEKDERKRVLHLFDSFKKQIRTGYFELPNALPERRQP